MFFIFFLLFLLALIILPLGLINPSWIIRKGEATRKKVLVIFGGGIILLFILSAVTVPPAKTLTTTIVSTPTFLSEPSPSPLPTLTLVITEEVLEEVTEEVIEETTLPPGQEKVSAKIIKVIDGDTIAIEGGETVRYIGIDTPETVDPRKPVQCYGQEAANKNRELVEDKTVELEKDISETDKYGRLLRYVWVGDLLINEYLVREGYAQSSTFPPDVKYQDRFLEAQRLAREEGKGLWSDICDVAPTKPAITQSSSSIDVTKFTCSSNTYNCSDFTTHIEAQAVFEKCGGISNDVHRLDQEKDGLACESLP